MTRRRSRTDSNQAEIVDALRKAGCSVECLHMVGKGVPDLLVSYWVKGCGTPRCCGESVTVLMEVKRPGEVLNALQRAWLTKWIGIWHVVKTAEEALEVIHDRR